MHVLPAPHMTASSAVRTTDLLSGSCMQLIDVVLKITCQITHASDAV